MPNLEKTTKPKNTAEETQCTADLVFYTGLYIGVFTKSNFQMVVLVIKKLHQAGQTKHYSVPTKNMCRTLNFSKKSFAQQVALEVHLAWLHYTPSAIRLFITNQTVFPQFFRYLNIFQA